MSRSEAVLCLHGFASFESPWNLQLTGSVLSEQLFRGIPFGNEVPGLRDEVPAMVLSGEVLGLVLVLYGTWEGSHGLYTLNAETVRAVRDQTAGPSRGLDIGQWLAQLVATIPEFKVTGHSPAQIAPHSPPS